jgi:beta-glucosidase
MGHGQVPASHRRCEWSSFGKIAFLSLTTTMPAGSRTPLPVGCSRWHRSNMALSVSAVSRRTLLSGLLTGALITAPRRPQAHQANDKEKVDALVAKMTLEEKVGQLALFDDPFRMRPRSINPEGLTLDERRFADEIRAGRIGALLNGVGAEQARYAQELAVNESRLGIPLLFAADIVHGLRTIFPVPLGEAASWDPNLAERTARAAAAEGAASGIHQTNAGDGSWKGPARICS